MDETWCAMRSPAGSGLRNPNLALPKPTLDTTPGSSTPPPQYPQAGGTGLTHHCTRGESAVSSSIPSISAAPASTAMYWRIARRRVRSVRYSAMRARTAS